MAQTASIVMTEGPANALDLRKDCSQVIVAGRSILKIYNIEDNGFTEKENLRVGKNINLNFSCNDVNWSQIDDQIIATAATSGAVVVWNLGKSGRSKQEHVYRDHSRTVNKVIFHPRETGLLISGSQDGTIRLFDLRQGEKSCMFQSNTESIRDVQFNPHTYWQFVAVSENGKVQLWDMRRNDRCEKNWPAHNNHVFACDWHPELSSMLATAGRDKTIKVWDTAKGGIKYGLEHTIHTIGPVGRVKWRPFRRDYLGSSSLVVDFAINVWDVKRPYVPFASFGCHKDVTTDIAWKGDPHILISTSKDGTLCQHVFKDAVRPGDNASPVGLGMSHRGEIMHAHRFVEKNSKHASALTGTKTFRDVFPQKKAPVPLTELFRMCKSRLATFTPTDTAQMIGLSEEVVTRELAMRYKVSGVSLSEACDHNHEVAKLFGRQQVALSWTVLKTIYSSMRSEVRPLSGDTGVGQEEEWGRSSRHRTQSGRQSKVSMTRGRNPSGKTSRCGRTSQATAPSRNVSGNTSESESEEDEYDEDCQTLTEIAGGGYYNASTMSGDFFGDAELAGLGVEHLVSLEGGSQLANDDWELPTEAFEQRQEILEGGGEEEVVVGVEGGDSGEQHTMQTVTVEDQTSDVVVWGAYSEDRRPSWNPSNVVAETMLWLAEKGDVQNAVSMYLVISGSRGGDVDGRVRALLNDDRLEHWFLSYVDLLQRFQLFTIANQMVNLCPIGNVNSMNRESTTVFSSCGKCSRNLARKSGTWYCERCHTSPSKCSVCHAVVRGLFVWCQGCGHGGHLQHVKEWMASRSGCPAGCGHHCEFS